MNAAEIIPRDHAIIDAVRASSSSDVWLVGGFVRDALLGCSVIDLDFTTTGDAAAIAQRVAALLNGRVSAFNRFLTQKVVLDDGTEIDVATARAESYAHPGALPDVRRGTLEEDLLRRDFAANALAVNIATGEIADPAGAMCDIEERVLRILHARSFIDDPTRILRGLRIGARLGFRFDNTTGAAMHAAIDGGALRTVSRQRLWREIFLAFEENDPAAALSAFTGAGVLQSFLSSESLPDEASIRRACELSGILGADLRLTLLGLLVSQSDISALEGSGVTRRQHEEVRKLPAAAAEAAERVRAGETRVDAVKAVMRERDETLAVAGATGAIPPMVIEDVVKARSLPLPFSGDGLGVEPGPHIGRALDEVRIALHFGQIDESAARPFATAAAMHYLKRR